MFSRRRRSRNTTYIESLETRVLLTYSVVPNGSEFRLLFNGEQFGAVFETTDDLSTQGIDESGVIVQRGRTDEDPDAFGSSRQENVFLVGGEATLDGSIQSVVASANGITVQASGDVSTSGLPAGTWQWNSFVTFNPITREVYFDGTTTIELNSGTLAGDLNIGKIVSNFLHDHELNNGGRGDSGDMHSVTLISGAGLPDTRIPSPGMTGHFPGDQNLLSTVRVTGNNNLTDPNRFNIDKPTVETTLNSLNSNAPIRAGWNWTAGDDGFQYDNFGAAQYIASGTTTGTTIQIANDTKWTLPKIQRPGKLGTLVSAAQIAGGLHTRDIERSDVDGDGDLDLVTARGSNSGPERNYLYINQGGAQQGIEGTFLVYNDPNNQPYIGIGDTYVVRFEDLDRDGDSDAIVGNRNSGTEIYSNNGGVFSHVYTASNGNETLDVAAGDIDRTPVSFDGQFYPDLYLATRDNEQDVVIINNGNWNFTEILQSGSNRSTSVELTDLNEDGAVDAIVTRDFDSFLFLNTFDANGWQGFGGGVLIGTNGLDVEAGDIDNDGDTDFVFGGSGSFEIHVNLGGSQNGTVGTFSSTSSAIAAGGELEFIDIDGDHDLDLLAGDKLFINQGGKQKGTIGTFSNSGQTLGPNSITGIAVGDYDGDQDLDVVYADSSGAHQFWENIGPAGADLFGRLNGNWWVAQSDNLNTLTNQLWGYWDPNAGWQDVQVADVDGDGDDDIVGRTSIGQWWVSRNAGGSFVTELWGYWVPSAGWQDVHVADVDHDGDDDIVGRTSTGEWWVARSDGMSGFVNELWGGWTENAGWDNVQIADLDGDGNADIIGQSTNGQWWAARSNGFGFTTEYWGYWVPSGWQDVQAVDVDNDGDDDVVGRNSNGQWWVARSNGMNGFTNELWGGWVESAGWDNVLVTDLDGDGNGDIVGQSTNGQWWAARSNGSSFATEYWGYWVPSGWQDVQVIDVDQDGNTDIIGRTSGGNLWVARSNGSNGFTNQLWGQFSTGNWEDVMTGNSRRPNQAIASIVEFEDDEESNIFG